VIVGGGVNQVTVGAGTDSVTTGSGNTTVIFGSGELGAGDTVTGSATGTDTVQISGDGNVIGAGGATLTSIENLVLTGTKVTIDEAVLEGFTSVSGNITTSELTVAMAAPGNTVDLSGVSLTGVKSITADNNAVITLTAAQIAQLGAITTEATFNLTINTDVAGLTALGAKATAGTGGALTLTVTDTNANILAGAAIISSTGATAVLSGTVTVAEALTALATNAAVTYNLSDTAANLANASEVVYNNTLLLVATTSATAFEATQIHAMITASNATTAAGSDFVAADVTLNVSDTASNVANSLTDSAIASDAVATSDTSSAAEALASYTNNNAAVFSITDTAANLATEAAAGRATLNKATSITYSDAATVAQVAALNAASTVDAAAGYALNDTRANLVANATVTGSAGNITVSDAGITVAQGLAIEALGNTGTNAYVIADTVGTALAASAAVTSSTTAISTSDATITVAQANALVSKYGASKVTDTTFDIADTAANLVTLSAASIAEADAGGGDEIAMTGTATVSQALNINAAVSVATLDLTTMAVSDTAANILAGTADATNVVVLDDQASITVSGATDVATITAINADLLAETTGAGGLVEVADGYTLTDTYALLLAANAVNGVVDNAGTVNVSDAVTVAQITNITTAMNQAGNGGVNSVPGTTLNYSLTDSAANVIADGTYKAAATSISVTDAAVTLAQATALEALTAFTDAYAISDTVANLFGATTAGNVVTLNAATSATVRDSVANLQAANGLTAIGLATTDTVVAADTEANLTAATTVKTNATSFVITDAQTTADVTTVNALAALKPTTYSMTDTTALMLAGLAATGVGGANEAGAVTTLLNGATMITSSAVTSVADFNTLDAGTTSSITVDITDTIANLTAATGATALANVLATATAGTLVISDTNGTVAQIAALSAAGATITGLTIVDTAANLTGATAELIAGVNGVNAPSDNGTVTHDVASLTEIYSNNGSAYASYNLSDTVANVVAAITADDGLVNFAQSVTATGVATVAQATTMQAETTMGSAIAYSITDTAALIAGGAAAVLNAATNLTANTAATVAQASTINAATNSGTTAYDVSDTAANVATAVAASVAGIEGASGTVTATGNATVAQADIIAAFTKAAVFSVSDTATNVAAASAAALNEAVNIATTGTSTLAQANTAIAASNSGTTTIAAVSGTSAEIVTLSIGANDTITTLSVTGTTTGADAVTIAAKDTGTNVTNAIAFTNVTGTAAELTTVGATVLAAATGTITASASTLAEYTALAAAVAGANIDAYSLTDSYTNLMVNSTAAGNVDADATITSATAVTLTDSTINVAQATSIDSINTGNIVYSITDNDANVLAALNNNGAGETALLAATSVTVNGTVLDIQTLAAGSTNFIVGTKAEIAAMSAVIQADAVAYEVSVADLTSDSAFYSSLTTAKMTVTDTAANLTGGNALLASAVNINVSDATTVANATTIRALSAVDGEVKFSINDTAANIVAASGNTSLVDAAINVTVTDAVTFAQAATIIAETNSGSTSYSITDVDTNIAVNAAALNGATNIVVTGTTGITSAQAQSLLSATNAGTTTIALATGTSAQLAALTLGANDTVTSLTPSDAPTVAEAAAMLAIGAVTSYNLSDTAANLAAADASVLNGATNIAATGVTTIAQATTLEAATNSGTLTVAITDTAAAVLGASTAALESDATIIVDDATAMSAANATALAALDTANANVTIAGSGGVGVYKITDTHANLVLPANATAVAASTVVAASDATLTVAQGVTLEAAATADTTPAYSTTDTYTNIVVNQSGASALDLTSVTMTVSNTVNVAQAKIVNAYGGTGKVFNISDTAAKVSTDVANAAVTGAASVTLTTAATVAQAPGLAALTGLTGGYSITDTAANVQAAIDVDNAAGAGRSLIESATSVTLSSNATVAQALGVVGTESLGLYAVTGISFAITDTVTNLVAGLSGIDGAGISAATSINTNSTAAFTVAQAGVWTAFSNWVGHDHDTDATTAARYYITDTAAALSAGDTTLVSGASVVIANGTAAGDTINLSMHSAAMTINGGDGTDTMSGGDGVDTFTFAKLDNAGANGTAVPDVITNFVASTDKLQFTGVVDAVSGQQAAVQAAVTALAAGATDAAIATAMANANTTNLGVSFAVFNGNTYVYFETTGATTTHVEADNLFIQLTGVTTLPTFAADVVA